MKRSFGILMASFVLAACGGPEEDQVEKTRASERSERSDRRELDGTWRGSCESFGNHFARTERTFEGETFTYTLTEYEDRDCTVSNVELFGRGVYELGEGVRGEVSVEYHFATLIRTTGDGISSVLDTGTEATMKAVGAKVRVR